MNNITPPLKLLRYTGSTANTKKYFSEVTDYLIWLRNSTNNISNVVNKYIREITDTYAGLNYVYNKDFKAYNLGTTACPFDIFHYKYPQGYWFDRATSLATWGYDTDYISFTSDSSVATVYQVISEIPEGIAEFQGKTITITVEVKSNDAVVIYCDDGISGFTGKTVYPNGNWIRESYTVVVSDSATTLKVGISTSQPSQNVKCRLIQACLGSMAVVNAHDYHDDRQIGEVVIQANPSTTIPGMLQMDGSTYNVADYSRLYSVMNTTLSSQTSPGTYEVSTSTFKIPDMLDRFPRSVTSAKKLFVHEEDALQSHTHVQTAHTHTGTNSTSASGQAVPIRTSTNVATSSSSTANLGEAVTQAGAAIATGTETRPDSIYMTYHVRY